MINVEAHAAHCRVATAMTIMKCFILAQVIDELSPPTHALYIIDIDMLVNPMYIV